MPTLKNHRMPLVRNILIQNNNDQKWVKSEDNKSKRRNKIEASLVRALDPGKVIIDRVGVERVNKSFDSIGKRLKGVDGNNLGVSKGLDIFEKGGILPSRELMGKLDLLNGREVGRVGGALDKSADRVHPEDF